MQFQDWGNIPYETCEERQLMLLQEVLKQDSEGVIVFCTHPHVVTLGRSTRPEDLQGWTGKTFEVRRGGRATYHGPDQLIVYLIVNLQRTSKDVVGLLRKIETSAIQLLAEYGLLARGKTLDGDGSNLNDTGVWVNGKKIASVGIAVKNWISYHGIALNIDRSATAFQGISPCGFSVDTMTSLEAELGKPIQRQELISRWQSILKQF